MRLRCSKVILGVSRPVPYYIKSQKFFQTHFLLNSFTNWILFISTMNQSTESDWLEIINHSTTNTIHVLENSSNSGGNTTNLLRHCHLNMISALNISSFLSCLADQDVLGSRGLGDVSVSYTTISTFEETMI
uniref:Uncharacterized protein n=1 Tax=Cressdnaviricota sp. TaxID=2748378 RepID=A0A6M3YPH0_9VIRU|nr:MAG: hypothetical protein [Cressdnaviricota sp.]